MARSRSTRNFVGMLRQDSVTDARASVRESERKRERSSLARSTSEGSSVVPQAKRAREAFSRARLGMRPLPRPASRRSNGGTSSFLSTAVAPLARTADRSSEDRNDAARRITCHRSIANTARRDSGGSRYVVCHIHHTGNEWRRGEWTAGIITAILYFYTYDLVWTVSAQQWYVVGSFSFYRGKRLTVSRTVRYKSSIIRFNSII